MVPGLRAGRRAVQGARVPERTASWLTPVQLIVPLVAFDPAG
jgi:hypothetical protein